jgi:hypothetical protein
MKDFQFTHIMEYILGQGWQNVLRALAQIFYNIRRKNFACPWQFWAAKQGPEVFRYHYLLLLLLLIIIYCINILQLLCIRTTFSSKKAIRRKTGK